MRRIRVDSPHIGLIVGPIRALVRSVAEAGWYGQSPKPAEPLLYVNGVASYERATTAVWRLTHHGCVADGTYLGKLGQTGSQLHPPPPTWTCCPCCGRWVCSNAQILDCNSFLSAIGSHAQDILVLGHRERSGQSTVRKCDHFIPHFHRFLDGVVADDHRRAPGA